MRRGAIGGKDVGLRYERRADVAVEIQAHRDQRLIAHQRALQTAGHNASNVNTAGFSRQRVDLASAGAGVIPAVWSRTDGVGNGVKVTGTVRIRDEFLEARALREAGKDKAEGLKKELEKDLNELFDMNLAATERMLKKMEERSAEMRKKIEKRRANKAELVKKRLAQMSGEDDMEW